MADFLELSLHYGLPNVGGSQSVFELSYITYRRMPIVFGRYIQFPTVMRSADTLRAVAIGKGGRVLTAVETEGRLLCISDIPMVDLCLNFGFPQGSLWPVG